MTFSEKSSSFGLSEITSCAGKWQEALTGTILCREVGPDMPWILLAFWMALIALTKFSVNPVDGLVWEGVKAKGIGGTVVSIDVGPWNLSINFPFETWNEGRKGNSQCNKSWDMFWNKYCDSHFNYIEQNVENWQQKARWRIRRTWSPY